MTAIAEDTAQLLAMARTGLATHMLRILPDDAADFAVLATIKGISVTSKSIGAFSNTLIAASAINKLALGTLTTSNGGTPFGATSSNIKETSVTTDSGKQSLKKLDEAGESFDEGDFELRIV